jgi:NAD(P)-dependent dehydrogenase (short-subunit alcohol dehydrogenase family)
MKLAGKVALVTGGARGIGRGIALAREGADVAIAEVDRVASAAQQYGAAAISGYRAAAATVGEIRALGRRATAIACIMSLRCSVFGCIAEEHQLALGDREEGVRPTITSREFDLERRVVGHDDRADLTATQK